MTSKKATTRKQIDVDVDDEEMKPRGRVPPADEIVTAAVPRAFILTDQAHRPHHYPAGYVDMPRSHAEHWYAKANGVEVKD